MASLKIVSVVIISLFSTVCCASYNFDPSLQWENVFESKIDWSDPNKILDHDKGRAIHFAVQYGRSDLRDRLIAAGADVSVQNGFHQTALHYASTVDDVTALVKAGVDKEIKDSNHRTALRTLLYSSYYAENSEVKTQLQQAAAELITAGADISDVRHIAGYSEVSKLLEAKNAAVRQPVTVVSQTISLPSMQADDGLSTQNCILIATGAVATSYLAIKVAQNNGYCQQQ